MDNMKEWTSLPMQELLTRDSCRKDWKRMSVESALMSPPPRSPQSNNHKWLESRKIRSVEKLKILPAGTKPRTLYIDRLQERGAERANVRRSSLKGREGTIVTRTNNGSV